MAEMAARAGRGNHTVGEKWGIRHPFGAAVAFFGLWIVVLVALTGVLNPILVSSYSNNPALLRLSLEAESLATVAIPAIVCPLVLGRFGHRVSELQRVADKGVRSETDGAPCRSVSTAPRFMAGCVLRSAGAFVGGMLGGILWFALACIAFSAAGLMIVGSPVSVPALSAWIAACVANAAFQEILVRGYAFDAISRGGGVVVATVATTLVFVAFHPSAFACGPVAVLQIVAASALLTEVRLMSGGLAAPIAMHAVWNTLGGIGLGVVALADDYPYVFCTTLGGPAWVSGGSMGLEGSVVTLAVTCILCVAAAAFLRRAFESR